MTSEPTWIHYSKPNVNDEIISHRANLLREAERTICGDRDNQYGPPVADFQRAAGVLSALGYRGPDGRDIQAPDIAILVSCIKMSRMMHSPKNKDHWLDIAGYMGCGWECVVDADR